MSPWLFPHIKPIFLSLAHENCYCIRLAERRLVSIVPERLVARLAKTLQNQDVNYWRRGSLEKGSVKQCLAL
jgi:hypothetical protein